MANRAELTIAIDEHGKIHITGPVHDKMVCYALLECARDEIKNHADALAKGTPIIAPSAGELATIAGKR